MGSTPSANEVHVEGRVSGVATERVLPSGDRLVAIRVIVPRPPRRTRPGATVDTFDCVAWTARSQHALLRLCPADQVAITGTLRRRFWRSERGAASRIEIEVSRVRRLRQPS
ncbi:hypothetical protein BH18ACT8_BH18ACT8_04240 [soil metagenome]